MLVGDVENLIYIYIYILEKEEERKNLKGKRGKKSVLGISVQLRTVCSLSVSGLFIWNCISLLLGKLKEIVNRKKWVLQITCY